MAISAYELLECVANMTDGQRDELYRKLWGSAEVELTAASDKIRRLNLHGHALDTIRGLEFLEDHQWRDLLDAMKAGLRKAADPPAGLPGMWAEANLSSARMTPPASAADLVPIPGTPPGATRSRRQPTAVPEVMGHAIALLADGEGKRGGPHDLRAALAQAEQHLLAARHTGYVIAPFPLEYMTHAEYVRDRVRGITDVKAAEFIADYLRPLLQDDPAAPNTLDQICTMDTALAQICADPGVWEAMIATRDPRSLRAMVLDLLFKDDRPGTHQVKANVLRDDQSDLHTFKGNLSWENSSPGYRIEDCVILGAGEGQTDVPATVACEQAIAIRREPPAHDDRGRTKSILDMSPIRPPVDLPARALPAPDKPDNPVDANDLFDAAIAVSWWLDDAEKGVAAAPLPQLRLLLDAGFELLSLRQQVLALEGLQPDEQARAIRLISGDIRGALEKIADPGRIRAQVRKLALIAGDESTNLKAVGTDFEVEQEALLKEDEVRRKENRMGGNPFDRDWST